MPLKPRLAYCRTCNKQTLTASAFVQDDNKTECRACKAKREGVLCGRCNGTGRVKPSA